MHMFLSLYPQSRAIPLSPTPNTFVPLCREPLPCTPECGCHPSGFLPQYKWTHALCSLLSLVFLWSNAFVICSVCYCFFFFVTICSEFGKDRSPKSSVQVEKHLITDVEKFDRDRCYGGTWKPTTNDRSTHHIHLPTVRPAGWPAGTQGSVCQKWDSSHPLASSPSEKITNTPTCYCGDPWVAFDLLLPSTPISGPFSKSWWSCLLLVPQSVPSVHYLLASPARAREGSVLLTCLPAFRSRLRNPVTPRATDGCAFS